MVDGGVDFKIDLGLVQEAILSVALGVTTLYIFAEDFLIFQIGWNPLEFHLLTPLYVEKNVFSFLRYLPKFVGGMLMFWKK